MVTRVDTDIPQVWKDYRTAPTVELRNRLLENYLPLVRYNAERIWARLPDGVDLDDLISAGVFGLMDAIEAFDLDRGVKFETYCVPRIRGAMLDELRTMDWVPRLVRSKQSKMDAAAKSLEAALGEIAAATVSCVFPLDMPPPDDAVAFVTVDDRTLSEDEDDGWSFGPGRNTIRFNGMACDRLKMGDFQKTEITFGCPEKLPEPPPPVE